MHRGLDLVDVFQVHANRVEHGLDFVDITYTMTCQVYRPILMIGRLEFPGINNILQWRTHHITLRNSGQRELLRRRQARVGPLTSGRYSAIDSFWRNHIPVLFALGHLISSERNVSLILIRWSGSMNFVALSGFQTWLGHVNHNMQPNLYED